jgi:peptidoglycan/LPS O-acetylase OafA/YrhL
LIYVVGIRIFQYLRFTKHVSFPSTAAATLVACLISALLAAEAFYWLVERPSKLLAHWSYEWITK